LGLSAVGLGLIGLGLVAYFVLNHHDSARADEVGETGPGPESKPVPVPTINPRNNPNLELPQTLPAYVIPYFQIDLRSRVPGPVVGLQLAIGAQVRKGDFLFGIDVPDLVEDVAKKKAIIHQREKELKLAEKRQKIAEWAIAVYEHLLKQKQSEETAAKSRCEFAERRADRFRRLVNKKAATPDVADERKMYAEVAKSEWDSAKAASKKAEMDWKESQAKFEAAKVDVELKDKLLEVAKQDHKQAKAYLGYATTRAPFAGEITRRTVDSGTFVPSGATGQGEPLLTLERNDIVTVFASVPDYYSPYVEKGKTRVVIKDLTGHPGMEIEGVVTRTCPSLRTPTHDRTMRVEVDFYNRSYSEYRKFRVEARKNRKEEMFKDDVIPGYPKVNGQKSWSPGTQLRAGTYGQMTLVLRNFGASFVVPREAIISLGGRPHVYLVKTENNKQVARLAPVYLEYDTGKIAKVVLLEKDMRTGREVKRDLRADDEIVRAKQGELHDGQEVAPTKEQWVGH
jgi:multidrug efflux pump subunit AcrA (membrane-fusion protein)